jgi:hypothetical protein
MKAHYRWEIGGLCHQIPSRSIPFNFLAGSAHAVVFRVLLDVVDLGSFFEGNYRAFWIIPSDCFAAVLN